MHEGVLQRRVGLGQLLEADDDAVGGRSLPGAFINQRGSGLLELGVGEDAGVGGVLGAALDQYGVAGIQQLLGRGGREAGAVLERLGLGAGMQRGEGHCDGGVGADGLNCGGRCSSHWLRAAVSVYMRLERGFGVDGAMG